METITINVDNEIAKAYREAAPNQQQKMPNLVNDLLKQIMQEKITEENLKSSSFREIVSQIRKETAANGLTPEILEELLNND
jgi:hypothetical protein